MFLSQPPQSLIESLSETQQNVMRGLVEGQSVSAAARHAGVHRTTVHQWIRTLPEFRETLAILRQTRANHIMDEIGDLADAAINTFHHILEKEDVAAGVRLKAALAIVKLVETQRPAEHFRESPTVAKLHADLSTAQPSSSQTPVIPDPTSVPVTEPAKAQSPGPAPEPKVPVRNAPCPCGSRLKYKRCCGIIVPQVRAA